MKRVFLILVAVLFATSLFAQEWSVGGRVGSGFQAVGQYKYNGSNYIEITARYDEETNVIKLFSAQDNLGKGAALQAIQAFNAIYGLDEAMGLGNLVRGV